MALNNSNLHASYSSRGVNRDRLDAILTFAGKSILDVGCGSGAYVLKLRDRYEIKGVDYQRFTTWDDQPELFSLSDATQLNWADQSVDTILSFETLEHLDAPEKALAEYYRVCRQNIILTVPNCSITPGMKRSHFLYGTWSDRTHIQFFEMESITELVKRAGFLITHQAYINKISLSPLIDEAFDFSGFWGRQLRKSLLKRQTRDYHITCLLVGEKVIK